MERKAIFSYFSLKGVRNLLISIYTPFGRLKRVRITNKGSANHYDQI